MYETVLKQIQTNYNIPNDIIQLIYIELNNKHQCAIIIQDEIKRLIAEKPRPLCGLCGIKYFMIEVIKGEKHYFIYKTSYVSILKDREYYNDIYIDDFSSISRIYDVNNRNKRIFRRRF